MRKVFYILGKLRDADVDWLAANGFRRTLSGGAPLLEEGKPVDAIYLLLEGRLRVTSSASPELPLAVLGAGEIVGEIALLDERPASATVRADPEATVLAVSRPALTHKLERDDAFAARFYRALAVFLADRLRSTLRRLGPRSEAGLRESTDELSDAVLDDTALAGSRFNLLLERLRGAQQ